jgi:FkbM family methyltransferase
MTFRQRLFKIYALIPENVFKKYLGKLYYQILFTIEKFLIKEFKIRIKNTNLFQVEIEHHLFKFPINPLDELRFSFKGYFKYYVPKRGDVIVDGGSYPAEFAVLCSHLVGENGKVIAFEPDPKNFLHVKNVFEQNNLTNVVLLNKGLWNKNSILKFNSKNNVASTLMISNKEKISNIVEIACVNLEDELNKLNINRINFIKLDIEGAEINVLKGIKSLLSKNKIYLSIASYHIVDEQMTCFSVENILRDYGFSVKTENLKKFSPGHDNIITFANN